LLRELASLCQCQIKIFLGQSIRGKKTERKVKKKEKKGEGAIFTSAGKWKLYREFCGEIGAGPAHLFVAWTHSLPLSLSGKCKKSC